MKIYELEIQNNIVKALRDAANDSELDCEINKLIPIILESADLIEHLLCEIRELKESIDQYQKPMKVIQEKWEPSECPRCHKHFREFEPCDDGYYDRAYSLVRCPYCGQSIKWGECE